MRGQSNREVVRQFIEDGKANIFIKMVALYGSSPSLLAADLCRRLRADRSIK